MNLKDALVILFVVVIAIPIVCAAKWALDVAPDTFAARKDQFQIAITQILLPTFKAIVTTVVSLVLGKPVVVALAERIAKT